jgi:hypothetical protein
MTEFGAKTMDKVSYTVRLFESLTDQQLDDLSNWINDANDKTELQISIEKEISIRALLRTLLE